jgi:hypothetical protein
MVEEHGQGIWLSPHPWLRHCLALLIGLTMSYHKFVVYNFNILSKVLPYLALITSSLKKQYGKKPSKNHSNG